MKELGRIEIKHSANKEKGQSGNVLLPAPRPYQSAWEVTPIRVQRHIDHPRADRGGQTHLQRYILKEQSRGRVSEVILSNLPSRAAIGKMGNHG